MSLGVIVDLGVSEGNDSLFYMQKGYQVLGVEADPEMASFVKARFLKETKEGRFKLLRFAASDTFAEDVEFYVSQQSQGASSITINPGLRPEMYKPPVVVQTIDWSTILHTAARKPRYMKIDIEGSEARFLRGVAASGVLPEFISVECFSLDAVRMLHEMGYQRFVLVEQLPVGGFRLPDPQLEGHSVANPCFDHASGPFGMDVFGFNDWTDFEGFCAAWDASKSEQWRTWHDCHAWRPSTAL